MGPGPAARKGHTIVAVDQLYNNHTAEREPALVLFGGRMNIRTYFSDVWAYYIESAAWRLLWRSGDGAVATGPHPRDHHAAAVVGDAMYMCSGWFEMDHAFDDMWRFDLRTLTWSSFPREIDAVAPEARFLVSLVAWDDSLYLFGGEHGADERSPNAYLNDVWAFNTTSASWQLLSPNQCPSDHSVHTRTWR